MAVFLADDYLPVHRNHLGYGLYPNSPSEHCLLRTLAKLEDKCLRSEFSHLDGMEQKSHIGPDGWIVSMDVHNFAPNEISVQTVNNHIIVEAKHEERQDKHGYISRQFRRRYSLPDGFKADDVVSTISSDGILTVKAPPPNPTIDGSKVRHIQIQHTGPASLSVKKNENKSIESNKK